MSRTGHVTSATVTRLKRTNDPVSLTYHTHIAYNLCFAYGRTIGATSVVSYAMRYALVIMALLLKPLAALGHAMTKAPGACYDSLAIHQPYA